MTARPTRPSRIPKQTRTAVTRETLIRAAAAEFCSVGFFATDSNAIARRANLSAGSFYNHFADKVEIFLAVYELYVSQLLALLAEPNEWLNDLAARRVLIERLLAHHRRWRRFRASLSVLVASDHLVRRAKARQRRRQLTAILTIAAGGRREPEDVTRVAVTLVKFEAVLDGLSTGELGQAGADEEMALELLQDDFIQLAAALR